MASPINFDRRRFLVHASSMAAAAQLGLMGCSTERPHTGPAAAKFGANMTFDSIKQIDAGILNVGYAEAGPDDGTPVVLLHGWPYDIHSYVNVAPLLVTEGYRVIVPYVRGYGTTRFLFQDTFRNGQPTAMAQDIIDLMDALKIEKPIIGGFDWGARTADIIASLWPQRCKGLVSVSGYLIRISRSEEFPCPRRPNINGGINITSQLNAGALDTTNIAANLRN